jgi:hypothetical protein
MHVKPGAPHRIAAVVHGFNDIDLRRPDLILRYKPESRPFAEEVRHFDAGFEYPYF